MGPVAGEKIRSMDIQRADTTVRNQTLAGCAKSIAEYRKFRAVVETSSIFRFSKFSVGDSLQTKGSMDFLKQKFQPLANLDLIDGIGNETSTEPIDLKTPAVQVFPNSTTGSLNISFTPTRYNSRVEMILVDANGKVVKEITDSTYDNIPTELHLDVSGYRKAIYILQINIDGAKSQQRVVIE
jgi:hypothetical protein